MDLVTIVSSHHERVVVRVGDVFIKVETDAGHVERELHALRTVTAIPVPQILWTQDGPPLVLAISTVAGTQLNSLERDGAWRAAGQMLRALHASLEAPAAVPQSIRPEHLTEIERWLHDNKYGDPERVTGLVRRASNVLDAHQPTTAFLHGDMQSVHVFIGDSNEVTGVIDWADSGFGDPLVDIAVLTAGHREFLDRVVEGYGSDVDRDVIAAYQIVRHLTSARWMVEHGYDAAGDIAALDAYSSPE